jgi:ubiquinone/menaquinone biosynthesis C-methylase UbiE
MIADNFFQLNFTFTQMKDNFSRQADIYSKYRPGYPPELFDFILNHVTNKQTAWDCGTGNGQSAKELANHFESVWATDISQKQIDNAYPARNIIYSIQPAEHTQFPDNSIDLVTVAQALHWFKFDAFYTEVNRVAKPGAWLAVWTYSLLTISPEIDELISDHHYILLEEYWDPERKWVDEHYTTIPFPFREIDAPAFQSSYEWTIQELEGYLNTWSALQKFIAANGYNPVEALIRKIKPLWKASIMKIVFPIHLRMGQIGL